MSTTNQQPVTEQAETKNKWINQLLALAGDIDPGAVLLLREFLNSPEVTECFRNSTRQVEMSLVKNVTGAIGVVTKG